MNSERKSRRRARAEVLSPITSYRGVDLGLTLLLTGSVLGMVLMFGGAKFWASGPFFIMGLLAVLGCQIATIRSAAEEKIRLSPPPGTWLWAGLCGVVLLRAVFAARVPYQAWTEFMQLAAGLMFYTAFSDLCNRRGMWKGVLAVFLLLVCVTSMYALWLHLQGRMDVLWLQRPPGYGTRASGTFACPNHFAHVLQIGLILSLALLSTPSVGLPLRLFAGYTLLPALPALVLTLSRAGMLGLVVGISVWVLCATLRRGWKRFAIGLTGLVVGVGGVFAALWAFVPLFRRRVEQSLGGDVRFKDYWPDTWNMIQGEGFWGAGPGMYRHVFNQYRENFSESGLYIHYAHNEFLHTLAEYGWLVTILLCAGLLHILFVLFRSVLRAPDSARAMAPAAMLAILTGSLVHALFDFNLHIPGAVLSMVMILGCLDGRGLQNGVWKRKPLTPALSRRLPWIPLLVSLVLIPAFAALFLGGLAEYRLDSARLGNDFAARERAAAQMRGWTPHHARGWTELGFQHRSEAFWLREPSARAASIAAARSAYQTALRWNPYDLIALSGLAELAKLEGDFASASARLEELVRLSPFDVRVRVQYGLSLKREGRLDEALAVFLAANQLKPGERQITLNLQHLQDLIRRRDTSPPDSP